MHYDITQVLNGLIAFTDKEVIRKLNTTGKWVLGTGVAIITQNAEHVMEAMKDNALVNMLGIVDEDGRFDIDLLADALKDSANRYGSLTIQVPLVGTLTFSSSDVDSAKEYIKGERV